MVRLQDVIKGGKIPNRSSDFLVIKKNRQLGLQENKMISQIRTKYRRKNRLSRRFQNTRGNDRREAKACVVQLFKPCTVGCLCELFIRCVEVEVEVEVL